ncbi:type IV toxin-antitoxin system AbiEi family antitoxin [Mesorhizobium sp. PAMC28654]|uniref:type IV toxin-antitoxin system AbiEi family antitoxin domain-containing protein n=1 Tax=Mesorhizobium sp. PAMC28654 TaxID=2880934 RepID=UPI001D09EFDB|nr:type IV toxin-antitoxin system AbiEi family antitoxin domain-containing protein [Mesorhizobium sp. PAMC28654]UDL88389.1 type IV toxin-antitoxin system AbiEi family antitoxin [Mesorhizobium sp. PAMC28654]
MTEQNVGKLNQIERTLPEGMLVDSAWMERNGYSTSLRSQYVSAGWLVQPVRGTYKRPLGELDWQKVTVSLQTLMGYDFVVGGRTALDLHGFSHYVSPAEPPHAHLYGSSQPPGWLAKLPLRTKFHVHPVAPLFRTARLENTVRDFSSASGLLLIVSTPERALLELLNELPNRESFHQVDMLIEGLRTLSPRRVQSLLTDCKSVKVKRLFFWFAERHNPPWLKDLDRKLVDLGSGKRMLVKGGKLDPKYLITVPDDMNAPV